MKLIGTILIIIVLSGLAVGCIFEIKSMFALEVKPDITPLTQVIDAISEKEIEDAREEFETTEQIKDYITKIAEGYNLNPVLALKIAECESQFRNVCNEEFGCSAGIGIYQILQSTFDETVGRIKCNKGCTWDDACPHNIDDNIDVAIWLMSQDEYWRWNQSKHCWGN